MDNKYYQVKFYDEYGDIIAVRVEATNEQHAKIRFMRYFGNGYEIIEIKEETK